MVPRGRLANVPDCTRRRSNSTCKQVNTQEHERISTMINHTETAGKDDEMSSRPLWRLRFQASVFKKQGWVAALKQDFGNVHAGKPIFGLYHHPVHTTLCVCSWWTDKLTWVKNTGTHIRALIPENTLWEKASAKASNPQRRQTSFSMSS